MQYHDTSALVAPFTRVGQFVRNLVLALACVALSGVGAAQASDEAPSADGVININTATVEQLRLLPRVGEEKAERIIAHRDKTPFKTVHEIARVRGIGLKSMRALKPWLTVSGPTTLKTKVRLPRKGEETAATAPAGGGRKGARQ